MRELRIHGRGGQGSVIASKLLAVALFREGEWVQSFPAFGVGSKRQIGQGVDERHVQDLGHFADDGVDPPAAPGVSPRIGLSAGRELPWRWSVSDR